MVICLLNRQLSRQSKKDKKADDKSKAAKDWTEEDINSLIELLEKIACGISTIRTSRNAT